MASEIAEIAIAGVGRVLTREGRPVLPFYLFIYFLNNGLGGVVVGPHYG